LEKRRRKVVRLLVEKREGGVAGLFLQTWGNSSTQGGRFLNSVQDFSLKSKDLQKRGKENFSQKGNEKTYERLKNATV
jgi:hypothetical protein